MRPLIGLLVVVLLSMSIAACGGSSKSTSSAQSSSNAASTTTPKKDRDDDGDNNDDDNHVLYYGHAPSASEKQTLVALITSYYAAAAANDGTKACALLFPFIAESVAENYGHQAPLKGKTCAVVMSKLFKQHHQVLAGENATLKFVSVRVEGGKALSVLSFSTLPEVRQIAARRDGSNWKILQLLDGILE
jgi:hypothetical protein